MFVVHKECCHKSNHVLPSTVPGTEGNYGCKVNGKVVNPLWWMWKFCAYMKF